MEKYLKTNKSCLLQIFWMSSWKNPRKNSWDNPNRNYQTIPTELILSLEKLLQEYLETFLKKFYFQRNFWRKFCKDFSNHSHLRNPWNDSWRNSMQIPWKKSEGIMKITCWSLLHYNSRNFEIIREEIARRSIAVISKGILGVAPYKIFGWASEQIPEKKML